MPTPALDELQDLLAVNGITADAEQVAAAIVSLAHAHQWVEHPKRLPAWLGQLAVDVAAAQRRVRGGRQSRA